METACAWVYDDEGGDVTLSFEAAEHDLTPSIGFSVTSQASAASGWQLQCV